MKKKFYLIIGGVRSGKSDYAQSLAKRLSKRVIFLATAKAKDDEMKQRIREHQKNRPKKWQTIEEPILSIYIAIIQPV
jgi:adenosylcobinamide kinase/adenosylcobinamide-phosphate guanylyltransferase